MILCPQCKHQEIDGTIFCSECGTQVAGFDEALTHRIVTAEATKYAKENISPTNTPQQVEFASTLALHLVESGTILPLPNQKEFTIGRLSEGQPIVPDIDLSPYNAYPNGVSRLHAVLKVNNDTLNIIDLESSNGTYVNGSRINPNAETTLKHSDIVSLGKLKFQVLFNAPLTK